MRLPLTTVLILIGLRLSTISGYAQQKPENKFSTFAIIARDPKEQTWGIAIATNNVGVGQHGVFEIDPDAGIVVSIAYTKPEYPGQGINMLKQGRGIKTILDSIIQTDGSPQYRQIALMDKHGNTICYTGSLIKAFTYSGHIEGPDFLAFGNSLRNDQVLVAMADVFRKSKGQLYERLGLSLIAGEKAGGQASGKMSAALLVKKAEQNGFHEADMRVDYSEQPFDDLQKLIDKKKSVDFLIKARSFSNTDSALFYLNRSAVLIDGWTLLYTELAREYYKLKRPDLAMDLLRAGLKKDSAYRNCLSWHYFLKGYGPYDREISKVEFSIHDWLEAVNSLLDANEFVRAEKIGKQIISKYPKSSYLHSLTGKALEDQGKTAEAREFYQRALELDKNNIDASNGLKGK